MNKSLIKEIEELSKSLLAISRIRRISQHNKDKLLGRYDAVSKSNLSNGDIEQVLIAISQYLRNQ